MLKLYERNILNIDHNIRSNWEVKLKKIDKKKFLPTGMFVLVKRNGRYNLVLGKRGIKANDNIGKASAPVGKSDKVIDIYTERKSWEHFSHLISNGILSDFDSSENLNRLYGRDGNEPLLTIKPERRKTGENMVSESLLVAAIREFMEEVGLKAPDTPITEEDITTVMPYICGRVNPFIGDHEGILVNFFILVLDEYELLHLGGIHDTPELAFFDVPTEILLRPNTGQEVAQYTDQQEQAELMHGLRNSGMNYLSATLLKIIDILNPEASLNAEPENQQTAFSS